MHVTVHERLAELGADDRESREVEALIARLVPLGRPVVVTDEMIEAARAGDAGLVASLIAEEVDPDSEDIALIEAASRENDGTTLSLEEVRAELNL